MVPTEPELVSLIESTRVVVNLQWPESCCPGHTAGQMSPELRRCIQRVTLGLCLSLLEVPV